MRFILAPLVAASLLAACQTPCPAPPSEPVTARLSCEDGSNLTDASRWARRAARLAAHDERRFRRAIDLLARVGNGGMAGPKAFVETLW